VQAPPELARQIHDRINKERVRRGLPTMRWDEALVRIAVKHSRDMAKRQCLTHASPGGRDHSYRYEVNGYACGVTVNGVLRRGAENIHRLLPAAEEDLAGAALRAWLENNADRKNVLSTDWGRQGIGVSSDRDGAIYITLDFC
jgi:uncharacterized protein YkwD